MEYNRIWVIIVTISFNLHMTFNEINTTLLLISLLRVCNHVMRSNVDFAQTMRQKYIVSNILEDKILQILWGMKEN